MTTPDPTSKTDHHMVAAMIAAAQRALSDAIEYARGHHGTVATLAETNDRLDYYRDKHLNLAAEEAAAVPVAEPLTPATTAAEAAQHLDSLLGPVPETHADPAPPSAGEPDGESADATTDPGRVLPAS